MSDKTRAEREAEIVRAALREVRDKIRVTKVIATRSVKGNNGDNFAGFSASWDTVEDETQLSTEEIGPGMNLREARLAHYMLAMQADIAAIEAAWAGGNISDAYKVDLLKSAKRKYAILMRGFVLKDGPLGTDDEET